MMGAIMPLQGNPLGNDDLISAFRDIRGTTLDMASKFPHLPDQPQRALACAMGTVLLARAAQLLAERLHAATLTAPPKQEAVRAKAATMLQILGRGEVAVARFYDAHRDLLAAIAEFVQGDMALQPPKRLLQMRDAAWLEFLSGYQNIMATCADQDWREMCARTKGHREKVEKALLGLDTASATGEMWPTFVSTANAADMMAEAGSSEEEDRRQVEALLGVLSPAIMKLSERWNSAFGCADAAAPSPSAPGAPLKPTTADMRQALTLVLVPETPGDGGGRPLADLLADVTQLDVLFRRAVVVMAPLLLVDDVERRVRWTVVHCEGTRHCFDKCRVTREVLLGTFKRQHHAVRQLRRRCCTLKADLKRALDAPDTTDLAQNRLDMAATLELYRACSVSATKARNRVAHQLMKCARFYPEVLLEEDVRRCLPANFGTEYHKDLMQESRWL